MSAGKDVFESEKAGRDPLHEGRGGDETNAAQLQGMLDRCPPFVVTFQAQTVVLMHTDRQEFVERFLRLVYDVAVIAFDDANAASDIVPLKPLAHIFVLPFDRIIDSDGNTVVL